MLSALEELPQRAIECGRRPHVDLTRFGGHRVDDGHAPLRLVDRRAEIAQGRMPPLQIVPVLDVTEDRLPGVAAGPPMSPRAHFVLQGSEEALRHRSVPAIVLAAHVRPHPVPRRHRLVCPARILSAAVGVMAQSRRWSTPHHHPPERRQCIVRRGERLGPAPEQTVSEIQLARHVGQGPALRAPLMQPADGFLLERVRDAPPLARRGAGRLPPLAHGLPPLPKQGSIGVHQVGSTLHRLRSRPHTLVHPPTRSAASSVETRWIVAIQAGAPRLPGSRVLIRSGSTSATCHPLPGQNAVLRSS